MIEQTDRDIDDEEDLHEEPEDQKIDEHEEERQLHLHMGLPRFQVLGVNLLEANMADRAAGTTHLFRKNEDPFIAMISSDVIANTQELIYLLNSDLTKARKEISKMRTATTKATAKKAPLKKIAKAKKAPAKKASTAKKTVKKLAAKKAN